MQRGGSALPTAAIRPAQPQFERIHEREREGASSGAAALIAMQRVATFHRMAHVDNRSQRERMLAGAPYTPNDPEIQRHSRRAMGLIERYNRSSIDDAAERERILSDLLGSVGEGVVIRPPFYCDYGSQIRIGARTFVNFNLVALDVACITIGEDVQFGPNVQLLTPTHPTDPEQRRAKIEAARPIAIGDNVWLGGGVIVCPGVTIGENTVVGAGAVVTRNLPPNVVAVGNPARIIRSL
jgi:maltose O-acetyltransferase